jgi:hypothetical protein
MSRPLQLHIPTPCHENWENMHPNEKGRHCAACQKTVVDFTLMSDAEVIHYFSKAAGSVCGRVGSDQLNRKLEVPRPPRKSPWVGWPVLLSGLLFTSDEPGSHHSGKPVTHQCARPATVNLEDMVLGGISIGRPDTSAIGQVGDRHEILDTTVVTEVGAIMVVDPDEIHVAKDTIVSPYDLRTMDSVGAAVDSLNMRRTLAGLSRNIVDTVKEIVVDSLKAMGIKMNTDGPVERDEATVYPNPAPRGGSLNLSWKKEAVAGRVNLINMNGAQIQSWMIQGGSMTRTLTMPADLAAGVYILQIIIKNGGYTRKVVVE